MLASKNNYRGLVVIALFATAFVVFLWSDTPYDIDDAPITYRYAENLAAGNGFVYNIGEQVQGTSTPLFTLVLATARLIGISIPLASNAIGLIASVGIVAVTMALIQKLNGSFLATIISGIILLTQGTFIRYSMAGMETPFYTLLIMLSLLALAYERTYWSAAFAALAAFTRLDGIAIVGAVLLACIILKRRFPWKQVLLVAVILAPWFIFAILYFGSPLPLSMLAKQQHLQSAQGDRFWIWEYLFTNPLRGQLYLLPFMLLGLLLVVRSQSELRKWNASVVWLAAYLAAYTLVGIAFYEWYLMPAYPILSIFAALGLTETTKVIAPRLPTWAHLGIAILVSIFIIRPYIPNAQNSVEGFKEYLTKVEGTRVTVGTWLYENTPSNSRILYGAIGHVGYVSNRYILDGAGLVTLPKYRILYQPDYILHEGPSNDDHCKIEKEFDTGWSAGPQEITISKCTLSN